MTDYIKRFIETKFAKMREVGKYTTECLDEISQLVNVGLSTEDINEFVMEFGNRHKLKNAQYNYNMHGRTFPAYCCTSLNESLCHEIPNVRTKLKNGDILKVDITFIKDGFHGDACRTFLVGKCHKTTVDFVETARNTVQIGIQQVFPGNRYGAIGRAIEEYCKHNHVRVARDFVGHGIGEVFHDFPSVSHIDDPEMPSYELEMMIGDTFTIEPIIVSGNTRYITKRDGWTTVTRDGSLAAQFEKTVGVTENGAEVFCQ
jgi:methionyl aminopeptidase